MMLKRHLQSRKFFLHFTALAAVILLYALQGRLGVTFSDTQLVIVIPLILGSYAAGNVIQKRNNKEEPPIA